MRPPLERIRVSQHGRDALVTLKRRTGIEHWNVLCRWAFFDSLANPNVPVPAEHAADSNVEISWEVFAGDLANQLLAIFALRAAKDGVPSTKTEMAAYFRSHLERGILQLQSAGNLAELCQRALR
ncbi:MAG: DNA sulfur modification protein DndE [Verrucomicrobia bacterium]|nr:MAG: DNA sulfur modification protein DndE [Verrucomicrobiota bacterium]